jgi:hypothetical protein
MKVICPLYIYGVIACVKEQALVSGGHCIVNSYILINV